MDKIQYPLGTGPTQFHRWIAAAILGVFIMVGLWGHAWLAPDSPRYQSVVMPQEDEYYIMDNQTGNLFNQRGVHLMENNRLRFVEYPLASPLNVIKEPLNKIRNKQ